jgi:hypothetical protein
MSENIKMQDGGNPEQVSPDTRASILQATFKHYFEMAMDHHTKAAMTSNFLLIIVGAIISFVSLDARIGGTVDLLGGLAVFVIGLFGAAWTWKQHERYYFWQHIAYEYQNELKKIVPELQTGKAYYDGAEDAAAERYTSIFAKTIHERWLWVSLHSLVAAIGLGLMALAA